MGAVFIMLAITLVQVTAYVQLRVAGRAAHAQKERSYEDGVK